MEFTHLNSQFLKVSAGEGKRKKKEERSREHERLKSERRKKGAEETKARKG